MSTKPSIVQTVVSGIADLHRPFAPIESNVQSIRIAGENRNTFSSSNKIHATLQKTGTQLIIRRYISKSSQGTFSLHVMQALMMQTARTASNPSRMITVFLSVNADSNPYETSNAAGVKTLHFGDGNMAALRRLNSKDNTIYNAVQVQASLNDGLIPTTVEGWSNEAHNAHTNLAWSKLIEINKLRESITEEELTAQMSKVWDEYQLTEQKLYSENKLTTSTVLVAEADSILTVLSMFPNMNAGAKLINVSEQYGTIAAEASRVPNNNTISCTAVVSGDQVNPNRENYRYGVINLSLSRQVTPSSENAEPGENDRIVDINPNAMQLVSFGLTITSSVGREVQVQATILDKMRNSQITKRTQLFKDNVPPGTTIFINGATISPLVITAGSLAVMFSIPDVDYAIQQSAQRINTTADISGLAGLNINTATELTVSTPDAATVKAQENAGAFQDDNF